MNFYSLTHEDLKPLGAASASMLFNWHYKKNLRRPCEEHNLPRKTREFAGRLDFNLPQIHTVHQSADQTVKFLFELADGQKVETVLIPFQGKYSVCLSSQVGCAVGCTFCHTGLQGYKRQLKTEDIIGQLLGARSWLDENRGGWISNAVFMGQGEPLHNFEAVARACKIMISQHGLSMADHKITVSTSGHAPGLRRWKSEMPDVNIALSLHSPFNEKRDQIIPLNRRFPLEEILPLADAIPTGKKRFVTYEYLLLESFNDGEEDAFATGRLLEGKKAYVNLIPFNAYPGARFAAPPMETVLRFKEILDSFRIPTLIRAQKGDEILAACGQLNTSPALRPVEISNR
jgi:23S rRNA (adenine2503-C2)-methyltransferase